LSQSSREVKLKATLHPRKGFGQTFSHAAFNSTGTYLYTWAYGDSGTDSLYIWSFQNGMIDDADPTESHYVAVCALKALLFE
jgi:hypothetical protein